MVKLIPLNLGAAFGEGTIRVIPMKVNWPETKRHQARRRHTYTQGRKDKQDDRYKNL